MKSYTVNNEWRLGGVMEIQALTWYSQHRLKEARSYALRAASVYDKLGAAKEVQRCREFPRDTEEKLNAASGSGFNCEFPTILRFPVCINSPF